MLSWKTNHFMHVLFDPFKKSYEFSVNMNVHVEIFYTEDVALSQGMFDTVEATGTGSSKIEGNRVVVFKKFLGLAYNKSCTVCNLNLIEAPIIQPQEMTNTLEESHIAAFQPNDQAFCFEWDHKRIAKEIDQDELDELESISTTDMLSEISWEEENDLGKGSP